MTDFRPRIRAIQTQLGITADGDPGEQTWSAIENLLDWLGHGEAAGAAKASLRTQTAQPPSLAAVARPGGPEPRWIEVARPLIGTKEIPGPANNSWIAQGWARLGAPWFNADSVPWCGYFVAHCIEAAGLPYPTGGKFAQAKAWLNWGKSCPPVFGAVAVFGRTGGGHVGFVVGESKTALYILGGNQSDKVSITPIAKSRLLGFRWPASLPVGSTPLPQMSGGTISTNEA